ncbi:MAG TPA: carboxy terminal-processing peptidase [Flavobacteriaceae bacterium]|nr:carboxy terminal-processing peptidase [Flavobacteriaceae bacterium]
MIKSNLKWLLLGVFIAVASCSFTTKSFTSESSDSDKLLVELISHVLERGHFSPVAIDDVMSEQVYEDFLEVLDPAKRFLLKSDVNEFEKYKLEIDDQLKAKDFTFFTSVHTRFLERREEVKTFYQEILASPFDFSVDEVMLIDYEEREYPETDKDLYERWRVQLKLNVLETYYDKIEEDKAKAEKDAEYEPKSKSELEKEARESVQSTLDDYFDFTDDLERKDYFAMYLNAFTEAFDPHTSYMAPQEKDRFDTHMSGKIEGIGAQLQKTREYIKITKVISGGPAWRGEHLEVGDMIMRVRQEDEEESVDISAMRLDAAVNLIKGPKGTKVILTVKRVDGTIEDVAIERDVVELEETYAKSSLINVGDKTYGLIDLPQFYFDMDNYRTRNAASDVEKAVKELKAEGMQGLVLDLRNNGGGSLRAAIDMTGLFIEGGPVVQVVSSGNKTEVLRAKKRPVVWDGPLVILINEVSASASEILAAAIQDYGRGIVLGSKQSYGKGTVQNLIDLNVYVRKMDIDDLGALKITTQKFYRINGGSTQLEGVKSDIVMPDRYTYIDIGERDYKNPMPYDKIAPANYTDWKGNIAYEDIIKQSKARLDTNQRVQIVDDYAKWIRDRRDEKEVQLNFEKYKAAIALRKEQTKKYDTISKFENNLTFASLKEELGRMETDTTLAERRKRWHKSLNRDIYVDEAVHVIEDLQNMEAQDPKLVDKN